MSAQNEAYDLPLPLDQFIAHSVAVRTIMKQVYGGDEENAASALANQIVAMWTQLSQNEIDELPDVYRLLLADMEKIAPDVLRVMKERGSLDTALEQVQEEADVL